MKTKRFFSLLLCAALVLVLLPVTARAATVTNVPYIDEKGVAQTASFAEEITSASTSTGTTTLLDTGWYIVSENVTYTGHFLVSGDVNLILADGTELAVTGNGNSGIRVSGDNSLTIYGQAGGTGKLEATGSYSNAGIGGGSKSTCGTITINGGMVTANGGMEGAGIGGGADSTGGGTVIINGGIIEANGGEFGAGIGGGERIVNEANGGNGGTVTINGGTVNATAGRLAAGIGGGRRGDGGNIYISGGTVMAKGGGAGGADIGGGYSSDSAGVLKNKPGGQNAYLTTVTLQGAGAATISSLTTDVTGYAYGTRDMKTDAEGKLYLWLPNAAKTTAATAGGLDYISYTDGVVTTNTPATSFGTLVLPDTTPPAVSSVTPNGTGAPLSGNIAITFSEAMDATAGTVSLNGGTALTGGIWSSDYTVYTVPYSDLAYSTAYTMSIYGFEDAAGNEMDVDSTHTFTTISEPDTTPPAVSSVTPNGTDVPRSGNITITFSEAMGATPGTVSLNGGTALTGGSWSADHTVYTVPYSGLAYSTAYTVSISGFEDTAGNGMDVDSTHTFTTISEPDTTPPAVSSVTPKGMGAPLSGNIAITFSEAMDATAGTVSLNGGTALTGGSWSSDYTVYTVPYSGLAYSTAYTVGISGFEGAVGNEMEANSTHGFTTVSKAAPQDSGGDYIFRSLTDSATGVTVSGVIYKSAQLAVMNMVLGSDPACDAIRKAQKEGQVILGVDIGLSRGFIAPLTISIPVGSQYNGKNVTILHCINGKLETITATVVNSMAAFTVKELSPFAVTTGLPVQDEITGVPNTGDTASSWGFLLIGLAAAAAGFIGQKRLTAPLASACATRGGAKTN